MTIAGACRPPAQESCQRLAGRRWIAQHPPRRVVQVVGTAVRLPLTRHYVIGRSPLRGSTPSSQVLTR